MAYLSNILANLAPPSRTIADDVLNPPADWVPRSGNIPSYQDWLAAQGPNYRPRGDNTPEYEYANQFYQLPTNNGDLFTQLVAPGYENGRLYLDPLAEMLGYRSQPSIDSTKAALIGGAGILAGGALTGAGLIGAGTGAGTAPLAGAGATEGAAALAGAELTAPVGTALATPAQEAAIADLVATGVSQEAATAAVMSGGATLSEVGTGLGIGGAGTGIMQGAGGAAAISRVLNGTASTEDLISVLGTVGATGIGMVGSSNQADALERIVAQSRADRSPFLSSATNYLTNPSAYYDGPGRAALDANLRALSAKFGNPADSPAAQAIATEAAMRDWRDAVTGFANLGLGGEDTRARIGAGAAQADADILTTLGGGLSDLINPKPKYTLKIG